MNGQRVTASLSMVKGQSASEVALISYDRPSDLPSAYDLWDRWHLVRGTHVRFLALPGETNETSRKSLNDALKRCLRLLSLPPPAQGKFTSHSLRI